MGLELPFKGLSNVPTRAALDWSIASKDAKSQNANKKGVVIAATKLAELQPEQFILIGTRSWPFN